MIFPIVCKSCGRPIADKWNHYLAETKSAPLTKQTSSNRLTKSHHKKVLEDMGITSECCTIHFLTHVDQYQYVQ